jgi:protein-S-isoprenylcysteine O-methyltransferase Ste14
MTNPRLSETPRMEERWMRERFGPEYTAYSQSVSARIPKVL